MVEGFKMRRFCSLFVVIPVLLFSSNSHGDSDYDYDDVCSFVGGDAGNCVPLEECKPLLRLIKSRPILKRTLGILVNLTCEFHQTDPKVCCPDEERYLESSEIVNVIQRPFQNPAPLNQRLISLISYPPNHDPSFRNHRNFGKIPAFEKCSLSLSSYLRKARGGVRTFRGQFPWIALIGYKNGSSGEIEFHCGGTIITKKHILTSAQCTNMEGYGQPIAVRLAEHDLLKNPDCINAAELGCSQVQDVPIESVVVHKGFNWTAAYQFHNFDNDIAVIALAKEISFDIYIQPVCLPFVYDYDLISFPKRLDSVTTSYLAGWQSLDTSQMDKKKSIMELTVFPIKSNSECMVQYYPLSGIKDTQICAGSEFREFRSNCCANLGSGLMISHTERSMGKYFQVGIASYGPFYSSQNPIPGIFTRVSSHLQFILNALD